MRTHGASTPREDESHFMTISGGVNLDRWTKREVLENLEWPVMPLGYDKFGKRLHNTLAGDDPIAAGLR